MKILQVCGDYSWGGIEIQTVNVSNELQNMGHDVSIFTSADSQIFNRATEKQINTVSGLFDRNSSWIKSVKNCKKLLITFKPDIIHVQRSHDLSVVVMALRLLQSKTPLVFTRRMESRVKKKSLIHRFIYSRVNKAWCVSSFVRENFLKTSPMKAEKVFVMNNGIDLEKFCPDNRDKEQIKKDYNLPENKIIISLNGRISPMKGYADFIEAAGLLLQKTDLPLHFVMTGGASAGEDEYANTIYKLAENTIPSESYTFIDFQKDMSQILAATDIYVFASHRESFGNVLLEAMAMKLPIVSVFAGGVKDMIECGKEALCINAQSPNEIAASILELLKDENLKNTLAKNAHSKAQNFSKRLFFERLENEYKNLLN